MNINFGKVLKGLGGAAAIGFGVKNIIDIFVKDDDDEIIDTEYEDVEEIEAEIADDDEE